MQYKNTVGDSVMDVDDKSRRVKIVISEMGSKDFDNDIIDHGAYTKTIAERGPMGKNKIFHLTDHRPDTKNVLGKFSELYVEGNQLIGVNNIVKTAWGNDALTLYQAKAITEHSVGFVTIKSEEGKNGDPRIIKEIKLYEGSAVLFGANENTPTLSVGKSLFESYLPSIVKEFETLVKVFKNGNLTDETSELIEIKLKQLEDKIGSIVLNNTTPADVKSQVPGKGFTWSNVLLNILN